MENEEEAFRWMVNVGIAARGVLKKTIARKCRLSKPRFSEMLTGDKPFPPEVKAKLMEELELEKMWARLSAPASFFEASK